MKVTTWWNQKPLDRAVDRWTVKALTDAADFLAADIRLLISIQGHPTARRSWPGEPPRRETGDLIQSWTYQVFAQADRAIVGSDIPYSYYLEVGAAATFGFIMPRPYVRRSLLANEPILAILLTPSLP